MLDVFVSYSRKDRETARHIADALQQKGKTVWWDHELVGGTRYRDEIRARINEARKTIVLWSPHSVDSAFVIDEASEAKRLGRMIPVMIETCEQPFGFGDLHVVDLTARSIDIAPLLAAIEDRRSPTGAARPARSRRWLLAGGAATSLVGLGGTAAWLLGCSRRTERGTGSAKPTALVIGNGQYESLRSIDNTRRDATLVASELGKRGFRVSQMLDVDGSAMLEAIRAFESTLSYTGGVGLFFYSGHAAFIDGEDLMIPVDATLGQDKIMGALNLAQIQREVRSRTTQKMRSEGTAVIYSASKGEVAIDGPEGGNSPFTSAFKRALAARDDELSELFRRVKTELRNETCGDEPSSTAPNSGKRGPSQGLKDTQRPKACSTAVSKQTPYLEDSRSSQFYFNKPQHDPRAGLLKVIIFDSCRDNPFKMSVASR